MDFAVKIGASKERMIIVNSDQTTSFLWEGENVLSTPSLIAEMEETCRLFLKEQVVLDPEWDSVGTVVNVNHLAATPVGVRCSSVQRWCQLMAGVLCSRSRREINLRR